MTSIARSWDMLQLVQPSEAHRRQRLRKVFGTDRQLANALAGRRENCIADGRRDARRARLAEVPSTPAPAGGPRLESIPCW